MHTIIIKFGYLLLYPFIFKSIVNPPNTLKTYYVNNSTDLNQRLVLTYSWAGYLCALGLCYTVLSKNVPFTRYLRRLFSVWRPTHL